MKWFNSNPPPVWSKNPSTLAVSKKSSLSNGDEFIEGIGGMTISINKLDANNFDVLIKGDKETHHRVHMSEQCYQDLSDGNVPQETVILESFKFLLEREPNTSILSEFDITVIKRYFPEYEKEIKQRLI